ncbi:MAG TPA: 16S rRNA (uracil(1498)-N(3))-methyltransferase [Pyrinomonadaceae bacterium]|nr:16S rRNA (uracil(1498)-N(3))-methyltransferase [Pyrinomonadaceae bacterium]
MTRRRFYAPPGSFEASHNAVTLSTDEARHLRDVLRLSPEEHAFVFDGQGHEYECVISEVRRDFARLSIVSEVSPTRPESPLNLTLAVALLKGEKFDLVVQKSTELGVVAIVPVITKLADVRLRDPSETQKRVTRWQRIALEAAKQSGRALVPQVAAPSNFANLLETRQSNHETCLMFSERLGKSLWDAIGEDAETKSVTALVGSEGGWSDEEISLASKWDWKVVTLGGRILRAETAAITICALLEHRFGDLN